VFKVPKEQMEEFEQNKKKENEEKEK